MTLMNSLSCAGQTGDSRWTAPDDHVQQKRVTGVELVANCD